MKGKMIRSILREYGIFWAVSRGLYGVKLKMLNQFPAAEVFFEKKTNDPKRIDLFEPDVGRLKQFIRSLPEADRQELKNRADKACHGRILGFSSIELDYGQPIRWQMNPITGKKCDGRKKWYQIPDFDKERGDIKAVWEISRFSHFITFARAYLLTGDVRYYKAFSGQMDDWLKNNPYSYGANFKCGQECALRMINAMLAYKVFSDCGLTVEKDKENVRELVSGCYRKILSNFFYAHRCIKNNHTISELTGMLIGAWCCEDKRRLGYAFGMLNQVIETQFTEDGGYTQYSFNYERLALQDLEIVLAVEKKTGFALNERARERLLRAAELMYQCQDHCGDMPNYGSNDGALVFPLTSCGYRDFRPVINTIYALTAGTVPYEKGIQDEELLWLGKQDTDSLRRKREARTSHSFGQAGLYTLRHKNSWLMAVLNDYHSRPAHMDQLHIDLWVRGINVLCDGGTFSYADEKGRKLTLNESHNTLLFGNKPQMNVRGPFLIYDWTKRGGTDASSTFFGGVMYSRKGYVHKREVKATEKGYRVRDTIKGKDGEPYEILFHTPCKVRKEGSQARLMKEGKTVCILKFHAPFRVFETSGSLYYLREEKVSCIAAMEHIRDGKGSVNTEILTEEI